ncbi:MAG: hypothetical protein AAGD10_20640 [Myxococcota bacterium]
MLSIVLSTTLFGQPVQIDPTLPERLRPVVERAIEAELDPRRGPNNGAAILQEAMAEAPPKDQLSLRLRLAGIELRRLFLSRSEVPGPVHYQQALTTFSRLDLTEPGLGPWRARVMEANPEVLERWEAAQPLKLAVLSSGLAGRRDLIAARLVSALEQTGAKVTFVEPAQADYRLSYSASNAPRGDLAGVTGRLEIVGRGEHPWKRTIGQTSVGGTPEIARDGAIEWLTRVGGRDMLFHWMGALGMDVLTEGPMSFGLGGNGHDGHGH